MFELLSRALKYVFIFLIYYFLLNFLKIMVADLRNEKSQPKETGFVLADEEGKSHTLFDINTIGRAEDADIIINDPFVSSKHALIVKRGSKLFLQDLNSTNGSFLNGKRVRNKPVKLKENDEILIGKKKLTFLRGETIGARNRGYLQ
jgi:pSer/pThr/pTyr-binding forkhead associated (FHA) protein